MEEETLSETDFRGLMSPSERLIIKGLHNEIRHFIVEVLSIEAKLTLIERHLFKIIQYKKIEPVISNPVLMRLVKDKTPVDSEKEFDL